MKDIKEITGLTECEFYEFYKDAKNLVLDNHTPADNRTPIAILTGGQPGAGKSGIVIKSRFNFIKILGVGESYEYSKKSRLYFNKYERKEDCISIKKW